MPGDFAIAQKGNIVVYYNKDYGSIVVKLGKDEKPGTVSLAANQSPVLSGFSKNSTIDASGFHTKQVNYESIYLCESPGVKLKCNDANNNIYVDEKSKGASIDGGKGEDHLFSLASKKLGKCYNIEYTNMERLSSPSEFEPLQFNRISHTELR